MIDIAFLITIVIGVLLLALMYFMSILPMGHLQPSGGVEVFHETWDSCSSTTVYTGEPGTAGNRPDESLWTVQDGNDADRGITTNGSNVEFAQTNNAWYYLRNMDCSGDSTYVDYTFKITLSANMAAPDQFYVILYSTDKSMKAVTAVFSHNSATWNGNADGSPDITWGVEFTLQIRLDYGTHEATFYIDDVLQGGPYAWTDSVGANEDQVRIHIGSSTNAGDDNALLDDVIVGSGLF